MSHVLLGWGSLLWDRGSFELPLRDDWSPDGPKVPIEFSRVSETTRDGALTLVIDPENGQDCVAHYAISKRRRIEDAICDLRAREGTVIRRIGFVDLQSGAQRSNTFPELADSLRAWGESQGFSSVIWTDLPSNFDDDPSRGAFSVASAAAYLRKLLPEGTAKAKEYVSRAHKSVSTPLRRHLESLEWWADYGATR